MNPVGLALTGQGSIMSEGLDLALEQTLALSIKNPATEQLARRLAAVTGESLTQVILHALEDRMERIKAQKTSTAVLETLLAISRRCSELPDLDTRSADEILGYDERGVFEGQL